MENYIKHQFTTAQIEQFKKLIVADKIEFFFVPSAYLRELTSQGWHPVAKSIPKTFQKGILLGNKIVLSKRIVCDYLDNNLKNPWDFILTNGEIRVQNDQSVSLGKKVIYR
tara:strand:+ start:432 stop:764 length:333 start_codon:yes stop_codon:yes gene_type:complete